MTANKFTNSDFEEMIASIPDAPDLFIDKEKMSDELNEVLDSIEVEKEFESLESIKFRLRNSNLSNDELIEQLASQISWNETTDWYNENLKQLNEGLSKLLKFTQDVYKKNIIAHNHLHQLDLISEELTTTESFISGQIKGRDAQKIILAKQGAIAKNTKYDLLKELAISLVNEKKFKSRRNAVMTIKPAILAESKKLGIGMSEAQAEITITGWLKKLGLPANI